MVSRSRGHGENRSIVKFESRVGGREVTCRRQDILTRTRKHRQTVGAVHTKNRRRRGEPSGWTTSSFSLPRAFLCSTSAFVRHARFYQRTSRKEKKKERGKQTEKIGEIRKEGKTEWEKERWLNKIDEEQRRREIERLGAETAFETLSILKRHGVLLDELLKWCRQTRQAPLLRVRNRRLRYPTLLPPFAVLLSTYSSAIGYLAEKRDAWGRRALKRIQPFAALYHVKTPFPNYDSTRRTFFSAYFESTIRKMSQLHSD